jgi:hypothetical protein
MNAIYGQILLNNANIRWAVTALSTFSILLSIVAIVMLGVAWTDVGLGLLVALGIGTIMGLITGVIVAKLDAEIFYFEHIDKFTLVLGVVPSVIGVGIFTGFSAALLIVVAPMLITLPMSYGLRAWAIRHYA